MSKKDVYQLMREKGAYVPDIIPESDVEIMLKKFSGGAGRVGFGRKIAVLVIDMVNAYIDDQYPTSCSRTARPAMEAIKRLLDKAREIGIPIFYSKALHRSEKVHAGIHLDKRGVKMWTPYRKTESNEIMTDIAPQKGDIVLEKNKPSFFFGTPLMSMLNYLNVDTTIVTGVVTSGCVRCTISDAFAYNFRVIIPLECVADRSEISHEVTLFDLDMKDADVMPLSSVLEHLETVDRSIYTS